VCGVFAAWAPIASAHSAVVITFNDCTSVTYTYSGFQASQYHSHSSLETLTLNGKQVASKTFTFSGSSAVDTVTYTGGTNGATLVASATIEGVTTTATDTLSGCPVTYTGDAYNVRASASLLGIVVLSPLTINEVGPVSTMAATDTPKTIVTETLGAPLNVNGAQLVSHVVTGSDVSTASTSVNSLTLNPLSAALISTSEIQSSSQTTCSNGVDSSTGSTNIASLTIGNTVVVGPGGLVPSGPIPKNTSISLGALGSVILNEQTPITDGLSVNAIDISLLTNLGLGSVNVIIGHAESDVEGC